MQRTAKVKCPGCQGSLVVSFKTPGFFSDTIIQPECPDCKSHLMFKFKKPQPKDKSEPGHLILNSKIIKPGMILIQIQKEQEEWNKNPVEA